MPLERRTGGSPFVAVEPSTTPDLATSFQTEILDTGRIHDELNRLWGELGDPPKGGDAPGEMVAESHFGGGGIMRANTLNLLAVAQNPRDAVLIAATVSRLRDFLPSRTIILLSRDAWESEDPDNKIFDVHVELKEQQRHDGKSGLHFETITISADRDEFGEMASLVSPLIVAELPDFLWWPGSHFARNALFEDLLMVVDRVIVDSAQLGRDASGVAAMKDLIDEDEDSSAPLVGDFTWLRLEPWRQLIAQFFDPPDVQQSLATIEQVTISYADIRSDGSSGFASALLTVGWLASRLDWEIVDPLERRKGGGWSAPLKARDGERKREVSLRLLPDKSAQARFSLREVQLVAGGDAPGTFRIERTDEDDLITSSETPSVPFVSRMVYAKRPSNEEMLAEELHRFGKDRVFEDSLRFATQLLP